MPCVDAFSFWMPLDPLFTSSSRTVLCRMLRRYRLSALSADHHVSQGRGPAGSKPGTVGFQNTSRRSRRPLEGASRATMPEVDWSIERWACSAASPNFSRNSPGPSEYHWLPRRQKFHLFHNISTPGSQTRNQMAWSCIGRRATD